MSALCDEACRQNYRCMLLDYSDLLDELLVLAQKDNLEKYTKKLKYYSKIKLLFIDDFAISRYSEEGIKILYHLIKTRDDLGNATVFTCQYDPSEWGKQISDDPGCYGKLDGIRRRLTTGYTILIEKV
jgi:DNA replication protein DnaC